MRTLISRCSSQRGHTEHPGRCGRPLPLVNQEPLPSTGAVPIGNISVDPGGGPIGTEHTLIVVVNDDFENKVLEQPSSSLERTWHRSLHNELGSVLPAL